MTPGRTGRIVNYILLILLCIIVLMPIMIMVNVSFKTAEEYMMNSVLALPESFLNFENYRKVLTEADWALAYKNTFFIIIVSTVGNVLFGTMTAYCLGRFEFRLKKILMALFLGASMIPQITTQVSTFKIINSMGLYNTIWASVVLYLGTGIIQLYIFLQFINQIPMEIDESAMLDGANYFQIYYKLIIPEMKPAIATVVIIKVLDIYNDMFTPYLYMPGSKLKTVTTLLMKFAYDQSSVWTVMGAAVIVVMIPTMVIYVFAQKYIMAGVAEGAVKG